MNDQPCTFWMLHHSWLVAIESNWVVRAPHMDCMLYLLAFELKQAVGQCVQAVPDAE